jgi:hypothetical protein
VPSTEELFETQVIDLVARARELTNGAVRSISIDVQDSGEYPYRFAVPDETLPLVGMARADAVPEETS